MELKNLSGSCLAACLGILLILFSSTSCKSQGVYAVPLKAGPGKAIAAFAEGCFWHAEIVFESVHGVDSVVSGYSGGTKRNPSYEDVTSETTGHAESVLVYYDPRVISFQELTKVFFTSLDPTQKDRQGNDIGSSYRSIIFYSNPEEKSIAQNAISREGSNYRSKIVTELVPLKTFYRAEPYHQHYIAHNPGNSYVMHVSIPDYKEFKRKYKGNFKPGNPF